MSSLVPEGWTKERLGDHVKLESGNAFQSLEFSDKGTPIVRISNIRNDKIDLLNAVYYEGNNHLEKFLIADGDILLAMSGATTGKIGKYTYSFKSYLNQRVGRFKIIDETKSENEYIYQLVRSREFAENTLIDAIGGAQPNISSSQVENVVYKFPPLPEQKKIASILTSVDEVIENTQKQIDKLQDLKKATMNELLTKGIGHTEFKDSELGRIPKSWEVSLIGEVCEVGTGKKDTQNKMKYGKYPFFVRSQTIERIDSYSFDGEAILTAGDGVGTGKVFHYVNGRFDFHQRVYKLSHFRGGALGKFLYYCFSSRFLKQVQQFSARGSVESVRMEMITGMAIPLPSLQEQSKIVDCISAIETNISIGKQKLSQTQSLKKSLMQDLLTGKVRVRVN
jgi:type I restriction enzyme S subunit